MARQLWMADVLRAAGLTVHEVAGWKTRGETDFTPAGLIVHETQGSRTSTDAGEINVMINGREGLAGPIAHLYLSRTGAWHVVTAGFSHHVKTGWGGLFNGLGNRRLLGIEAQHSVGETWTATQYQSYVAGVAAILAHTGWKVGGHKEHQPGDKSDPGFNMDTFRRDVAAVLSGDPMTTADIENWTKNTHAGMFYGGGSCGRKLPDGRNSMFAKLDHVWGLLEGLHTKIDTQAAAIAELKTLVGTSLSDEQLATLADLIVARMPTPPTAAEIAAEHAARLAQ